jgi:hypothetical protein
VNLCSSRAIVSHHGRMLQVEIATIVRWRLSALADVRHGRCAVFCPDIRYVFCPFRRVEFSPVDPLKTR